MSLATRHIYVPAHFGNTYDVMSRSEAAALFREWREWGCTAASTWFDPADTVDPFGANPLFHWARLQSLFRFKQKRGILEAAGEEGLEPGLYYAPNAVYLDQLQSAPAAEAAEPWYIGPNLCLGQPEGRDIIARNFENLLRFLREAGVSLSTVTAGFRDWGGCLCKRCRPWVGSALGFWEERLAPVLLEVFPAAKVEFLTWWMTEDEFRILREFLAGKPAWVSGVCLSLGYSTAVPAFDLPAPYRKTVFIHLSYGGQGDRYGRKGAVAAPRRLETVFRALAKTDVTGFQGYTEGIYDDLNKFLACRLPASADADSRPLVEEYVRRCFGLSGRENAALADAIGRLEVLESQPETAAGLLATLERLSREHGLDGSPRFRQLLIRAKVAVLENAIGGRTDWERIAGLPDGQRHAEVRRIEALVRERREVLENLSRSVYRAGVHASILHMDLEHRPWRDWLAGQAEKPEFRDGRRAA